MAFHSSETLGSLHIFHNWEYANASARTGASGFVAGDVGKVCRQLDDDSFWVLIATTPTWQALSPAALAAHASTHQNGGADEISVAGLSGELADDQPPKTHATAHQSGGGDAIKLDDLGAPDNNTDLNVSISAHGLCPILPNNAAVFFNGVGGYTTPSASDSAAIHDNVAAEISAVTEKTTPVAADLLLAEDSADSNNKKRVQVGNLGSGIKLDDLATPDDNTDLDASTSRHGLLLKLGGGTTNFLRADGTWAAPAGGTTFPIYLFPAYRLLVPNNSDWAVQAHAAGAIDTNDARLFVRRFTDSAPEGVGFMLPIPTGASNIIINPYSRAETAPGSTQTVATTLYECEIADNGALTSWSSGYDLTDLTMPNNEYFQEDSQTIALATLGLAAGQLHLFEWVRDTADAGDTLSGDWTLAFLRVTFS